MNLGRKILGGDSVCCSALQCVTVWCSALQCVAVCCSAITQLNHLGSFERQFLQDSVMKLSICHPRKNRRGVCAHVVYTPHTPPYRCYISIFSWVSTPPTHHFDSSWSGPTRHPRKNRNVASTWGCVWGADNVCGVLQCVAVRCNVLQCDAVRCSVLQNVAVRCSVLHFVAVSVLRWVAVSVLHCVALCCIVLQCSAVCCSVLQCIAVCCSALQHVALRCSVLQCVAVCCSDLQCVAKGFSSTYEKKRNADTVAVTHCNTLLQWHTATYCCSDTLQHTVAVTQCNTLLQWHSATHCCSDTLQHTVAVSCTYQQLIYAPLKTPGILVSVCLSRSRKEMQTMPGSNTL